MKAVVTLIVLFALIGGVTYVWCSVLDFIVETPKQLKRIADALEWRNKHGN